MIWKLFSAHLAGTFLQSSAARFFVYSHVQSQTVSSIESNAAGVATILPLILVNSHVLFQSRAILEHFVAMRTVNAISFVGMHVLGQTVKRHQFSANRTLSFVANRLMLSDSVMSQTRRIFEIRTAILAEIRP